MTKNTEEKIRQLQLAEQSLQTLLAQKQGLQMQLMETDSALKELANTDEAYKIIGNIMVLSKKDQLEKDLSSKKELIELRIKTLEKQENSTRENASAVQKEVLEEMKKDDKPNK